MDQCLGNVGQQEMFRTLLAQITFDQLHVVKILNAAVNEVRRQEQKEQLELKKTRWVWLKNEEN